MKIFENLMDIKNIEPTVIAVGNFDGIHLGHQQLIKKAVADAKNQGYKSAVFTFSNHPRNLLKDKKSVKGILYNKDKLKIINELGIDYVFNVTFDKEIMNTEPIDFIEKILLDKMNMKELLCGFNYRFGKDAKGDVSLLIEEGAKKNFGVHISDAFRVDGDIVSSSLIREKIIAGDMLAIEKLLGRLFAVEGEVVVGNRIGKTIGFPTSNLDIDEEMAMLPNGVYITRCYYQNQVYNSITNIGNKPTIGQYKRNIETHIFGFDKQLYGKVIKVEFLKKMRDELVFNGIDELTNQIEIDCKQALRYHQENS